MSQDLKTEEDRRVFSVAEDERAIGVARVEWEVNSICGRGIHTNTERRATVYEHLSERKNRICDVRGEPGQGCEGGQLFDLYCSHLYSRHLSPIHFLVRSNESGCLSEFPFAA